MTNKIKISFMTNGHKFTAKHRLPLIRELIKREYDVSCIAPSGSEALEYFTNQGFTCYSVYMSRKGMNIFYEVRSLFSLLKVYHEIRPQIVINATIKPVLYGTFVSYYYNKLKVVNLITGLGFAFSHKSLKTKILQFFILFIYNIIFGYNNQKVVFQNRKDKSTLLQYSRLKSDNAYLIPSSGADPNQFLLQSHDFNSIKIMLISRMIWGKGILPFVESAKIVKNKKSNIEFVLVGPLDFDSTDSVPLSKINEWQNEGIVEWWGEKDDMLSVYKQATIVVLPTTYGEGVPKTLLEASLCGRPIITTNTSGCGDAVINGKSGFLIPPNNSDILANKIIHLINNLTEITKMGITGREYVVNNFSTDVIIPQLVNVIENSFTHYGDKNE